MKLLDVDARRHFVHSIDVAHNLFQDVPDVLRPDEDRLGRGQTLATPAGEVGIAAHRVLELRPVGLHHKRQPAGIGDGSTHQHMVREHEIGGHLRAQRGSVERDVAVSLGSREVLQQLRLDAFVAVEHEDGQQTADVRAEHLRSPEVVALGIGLLANDDDVVTGAAPLTCECTCIDVRPRSAEQVPVPEQDPHRARP